MPDLNLLIFTIKETDFVRIVQLFQKWTKRPSNPLWRIDPQKTTLALANSVRYLLSDRITEGIGRGGWGQSDKEYMKTLYGQEIAEQVHESVMTTVVVTHALYDCLMQLENAGIAVNGHSPSDILDSFVDELELYLQHRWDARKGHGGVLVVGREGDSTLTPRYRHTAWLFHLWHLLPRFRERTYLTASNLLEEFDHVKWQDEKVATPVAAYSAFTLLESDPLCEAIGATARVRHLKHVLEGQIESKFSRELSGWTSGDALRGGRQLYTLFVCAEMAGTNPDPKSGLSAQMQAALESTMDSRWCSADGKGVPLRPNGEIDISASALAASALMRQPTITNKQKEFLSSLVGFLIERLAENQAAIQGTFSWALSYFVRDISRWLEGS